jgi:hypothetical protein
MKKLHFSAIVLAVLCVSIVIPFIAAAGSYNFEYDTGVIPVAEYTFDTPNTIYIGIRNSGAVEEEAYVSVYNYNGSLPLCSYTWIVNPGAEVDTHCNSIGGFYYVSIQVSSELLIPQIIFNGAYIMNSTSLSVNYNPGDFAVYKLGKRGKERIR